MNYADKCAEFAETNPAPTLFIRFAYSQTGSVRFRASLPSGG